MPDNSAAAAARAKLEALEQGQSGAKPPIGTASDPDASPPAQSSATPPLELGRSPAEIARQRLEAQEQEKTAVNAPPPQTYAGDLREGAKAAWQGLVKGGATAGAGFGIPGLIGSGIDWATGSNLHVPYPSDYLNVMARHGLYDPNWTPQSFPAQLTEDTAAAAPGMIMGPLNKLAPLGERAAYTFGPAAAGSAMNQLGAPQWLTDPLTTIPGSGMHRIVADAIERRAAATAAAEAEAARNAFKTQGYDVREGRVLQKQENVNQRTDIKNASQADVDKWHDSEHMGADTDREAVAAQLGTSKTLEEGAGKMQDKSRQWLDGPYKEQMKEAEKGMYYKPDGSYLIAQDATGDVSNLKESIKHSYTGGGEAEPVVSLFRSKLPEQVNAKLDMIAKQQGKPPEGAPDFTFDDMRKIRSAIGDALGDPSVISSIGVKKLTEMYKGISDDIRANVSHNAGPEGLAQFDKFNKEATRLFGVAGTVGDNIVTTTNAGKETITPYQVGTKDSLWNDSTKVSQLRSEPVLSQGVDEVAASKLRAGGRDAAEKFYNGLTPEGKMALYGGNTAGMDKVTARRVAADQGKEKMENLIKEQDTELAQQQEREKAASIKERGKEQETLRQADVTAKARLDAASNPWQRVLETIGRWPEKAIGGALGWQGASHFQPKWDELTQGFHAHNLLSPLGAGLNLTGAAGVRELVSNPAARGHLLRGAVAGAPSMWNADQQGQTP